jgi:hypothetical protein
MPATRLWVLVLGGREEGPARREPKTTRALAVTGGSEGEVGSGSCFGEEGRGILWVEGRGNSRRTVQAWVVALVKCSLGDEDSLWDAGEQTFIVAF